MLTVILGAGASYDSAPQTAIRPPLAKDLYDFERADTRRVLSELPQAGSLVDRMRRLAPEGGEVEAQLGDFLKRAIESDDPYYKADLLAMRFYLREITQRAAGDVRAASAGQTSQLTLVTRLHDISVSHGVKINFISFNYDNILEHAVGDRFGQKFKSLDDYLVAPFGIFKPHGSIDWIQELPLKQTSDEAVFYNNPRQVALAKYWDPRTGGTVGLFDDRRANLGYNDDKLYVPALAIPAAYKDAFIMPDGHLEAMTKVLKDTRAILIIGWRASETEFLRLCTEHLRGHLDGLRSYVVDYNGGGPASAGLAAISNFPQALSQRTTGVWGRGFADFVTSDDFSWEVGTLIAD